MRTHPSPAFLALATVAGLVALGVTGCVHRTPTPPLDHADLNQGFYFHTHERPNNSKDTLFVVCFSGGGTRAAALAYGVLEELRRTEVRRPSGTHRLLDEVDVISSVSGGSVTAASYALLGDGLFDRFESNFLKRNVQQQIVGRVLNPFRWNRIWSKTYGRSDIASELYDELILGGATFADLARRPGPFTVINATDISTGARFSFTQYQFDLICANLAGLRVSQAVAASSAVPGLLSPITLNNYAGRCGAWISDAAALNTQATNPALPSRAEFHLNEIGSYLDSQKRPYLHLVDGGLADNLGVRSVLDGLFAIEAAPRIQELFDLTAVERIAILVVNAYAAPEKNWDQREQPPGTLAIAVSGATIPMDRYTYETTSLLREQILRWQERQQELRGKDPSARELRFYSMEVSFLKMEEGEDRRYCLNLPTSFFLSDEAVDRIRDQGKRLLRESSDFKAFMQDLEGHPLASSSP